MNYDFASFIKFKGITVVTNSPMKMSSECAAVVKKRKFMLGDYYKNKTASVIMLTSLLIFSI